MNWPTHLRNAGGSRGSRTCRKVGADDGPQWLRWRENGEGVDSGVADVGAERAVEIGVEKLLHRIHHSSLTARYTYVHLATTIHLSAHRDRRS